MQPIDELPQDMWNEIVNFLQTEEALLTMTQVSKGTQDTAEHELTRRWVEQGFLLATGPKELAAALADPEAQVIIARGGTVDRITANWAANVIAAGPVAVAGGNVHVRDTIGTITSVTGGGYVIASGAAQVSNVISGTVRASDSAQVSNVISGGMVYAHGSAQVTDVTGGTVYARGNTRVSATGGEIHADDHASVHSDGATVHVESPDAMITATGGKIYLRVRNEHIIYSGDVTFYNDRGYPTDPPKAFGE